MAKLTAIQILNQVLQNLGEAPVTQLTNLSGIQYTAWQRITEALQDISTDENTRWQFLESLGRVPMTTGNYAYTVTALTTGSDMMREDKESFRQSDSGYTIQYITPQEFDRLYQKGISTSMTGYPSVYTKYKGQLIFNKQATTVQNGKFIDFRYYKLPTYYSTDTSSGTGDIPEPFDMTCLVALATLKVLTYLESDEAAIYKVQVFGNGKDITGSLDKMKTIYSSPDFKPRVTYKF